MVFNGDANTMDLCGLADRLVKTDDTDFPLTDKALYANWGMREIAKGILDVYGGWVFSDSNNSGEDVVTTNLLNDGTQIYAFATMQWLLGVSWKDSAGNWARLLPITLEQIQEMGYAETEFMKTAGLPQYYRPVKNGIKIYPTSSVAVTDGLKAHIGKDISPFTSVSTGTAPGFDSLAGHEHVATFMAMKFAEINTLNAYSGLMNSWISGLSGIKNYYSEKFKREFPTRIRVGNKYVDNFV